MIRILDSDGMEKSAVKALEELGCEVVQKFYETDDLMRQVKEFDALVVRSATKVRVPVIDAALETGRLKVIIRGGVGIDNIDADYAREKGIKVYATPNASSASVAELAIGHLFCLTRHIHTANVTMREGKWEKKHYNGIELAGKTIGLIGFGRIAKCVAAMAAGLGMNVIYTNRTGHKPENEPYRYVPIDELLAESDIISLNVPKVDKPFVTAAEIAKMKDGVYIINTSRGSMIVEDDLLDALDSGKVAGAGLDVFVEEPTGNQRLYTHPKISMTPHIGAQTAEAQARIGREIISIIKSELNL